MGDEWVRSLALCIQRPYALLCTVAGKPGDQQVQKLQTGFTSKMSAEHTSTEGARPTRRRPATAPTSVARMAEPVAAASHPVAPLPGGWHQAGRAKQAALVGQPSYESPSDPMLVDTPAAPPDGDGVDLEDLLDVQGRCRSRSARGC